ncbi:hypothetical protein RWE15_11615 [Virgibacillus halophilus]|uniref:Cytochrome P450 n=1 Tax=Tigheibacillus halophilus TaxID=361280 RepID=A0ABU5C6K5_9BACI|nr:hypothetical protein [Virgibacillus halophilus]
MLLKRWKTGVKKMPYREEMPVEKGMDHTLSFLTEGYMYISNRMKKYDREIFQTRLLGGKKIICLAGKDAAKVFYDNEKFKRQGAAPERVLKTLFGQQGVQTLDGTKHRRRKQLFMSLMTGERLREASGIFKREWLEALNQWETADEIVLYDEVRKILTKTACKWAGVPLPEHKMQERVVQLSAMFEGGGAIGGRYIRGKHARKQAEQWISDMINRVRSGDLKASDNSALYRFAMFQDEKGEFLRAEIAAVELINVLRPIVAISVYIVFLCLGIVCFSCRKEKTGIWRGRGVGTVHSGGTPILSIFPHGGCQSEKGLLVEGFRF